MSREFPDWINPWKAAEGRREFAGTIPLSRMGRLAPMLAAVGGDANFTAAFKRDVLGLAVLELQVSAQLPLLCQASLDIFDLDVARTSALAMVATLDDQDDLPGHYEPVLVTNNRLEFLELVQDELILGVPQVPRKPELGPVVFSTNPDDEEEVGVEKPNKPFAALAGLMKGKPEDRN